MTTSGKVPSTINPEKEKTMSKASAQEVKIDISQLEGIAGDIASLDAQISATSGSDAQVKKSISERLATENADKVEQVVTGLVKSLESLDPGVKAGVVNRVETVLKDQFGEEIDTFLTAEVEKVTAGSKDDVAKLREARKERLEAFKALKVILDSFGIDTSAVPEPKRSAGRRSGGGSSPKTGKNKEGYRYSLDGKDRPNSQNTFSSLAYYSTMGCAGTEEKPDRWGVKQLKEHLAESGVNFGEDDTWEVELPNGHKIGARRFTDEEAAEMEASNDEKAA